MATPKVCGIETEYGIAAAGGANPTLASSLLVTGYAAMVDRRTAWDFDDESPGTDARGAPEPGAMAPIVETNLANTVLTNGARFYVDHAHPEYSTPECATALELVLHDKAGEEVLRRAIEAAATLYPKAPPVAIYKNNSDRKGNSYGCHENYLVDRAVPFSQIVEGVLPHFVTRQVFAGAGKVGVETDALDPARVPFQISQRAEFFEEVVGLETTVKRPIVNTRDEPHADARRFRRLHVIVGDANLAEVATFLKVGTTALVLAMIEDRMLPARELRPADPVRALHQVSADLSLSVPIRLADGSTATALEVQWELLGAARRYAKEAGLDALGGDGPGGAVLARWEAVLHALETDPDALARQLDWVAKHQIMRAFCERRSCDWSDSRLAAMDLQYHDLRPERSLFQRLAMERLVDERDRDQAVSQPPRDTRAFFRGTCLARWPEAVVSANWDSLVFDVGADTLRRVPMMDPLKGTADYTADLLDASADPAALLERLSS